MLLQVEGLSSGLLAAKKPGYSMGELILDMLIE
jgi:hypothetical protein